MFSSTSNNTLMSSFPQYYFPSSSPYHQPPQPHPELPQPPPPPPLPLSLPLLNQQNDSIFLHQNHQYDQAVLFALANAQIPAESTSSLINLGVSNSARTTATNNINIMTNTTTTTTTKQDVIINGSSVPKKPVKKDRHSKIYTAQGLRDRRVRLSIDIAREFFDLHDMLGFDKASKTLEWLLTNSKTAIKELSRSKSKMTISCTPATTTTTTTTLSSNNSECEQADLVSDKVNELAIDAADDTVSPDHNNLAEEEDEEAMLKERIEMESLSESALMNLLAKESRAKARARARARTKEKRHNYNCSSSPYNKRSKNVERCGSASQISNQFFKRSVELNQAGQDRGAQKGPNLVMETQEDHHHHQPVVMIKKKLKFPSISTAYDHQVLEFSGISKGETSSNNAMIYSSSPTSLLLTQNWDNINNMISCSSTASPQPSFCLPA